jgi:hypothetical protein
VRGIGVASCAARAASALNARGAARRRSGAARRRRRCQIGELDVALDGRMCPTTGCAAGRSRGSLFTNRSPSEGRTHAERTQAAPVRCCSARVSVGAISAPAPPRQPAGTHSATTVFPEPTSPCSRRCIGDPARSRFDLGVRRLTVTRSAGREGRAAAERRSAHQRGRRRAATAAASSRASRATTRRCSVRVLSARPAEPPPPGPRSPGNAARPAQIPGGSEARAAKTGGRGVEQVVAVPLPRRSTNQLAPARRHRLARG